MQANVNVLYCFFATISKGTKLMVKNDMQMQNHGNPTHRTSLDTVKFVMALFGPQTEDCSDGQGFFSEK